MDFFKFADKVKTEIQQKKQQKKEQKMIGSMRHRKGMTLFAINIVTGEVKPAEYVKQNIITWEQALRLIHNQSDTTRRVLVEKNCVYIEALNAENAWKKYKKMKEGQA